MGVSIRVAQMDDVPVLKDLIPESARELSKGYYTEQQAERAIKYIFTPNIRILAQYEWALYKDLRLRALADSPDAFGSTLAKERSRSDADWASRLATGVNSWDLPLAAEVDGEPIGLAWGRIEKSTPDVANLYQMWVAPDYRSRGVGKVLLDTVIDWARTKKASCLELGVTCGNSPAWRLYSRAGFVPVGPPLPLRPGSELLAQTMRLKL